jgi:oxalate decarboxylase/phosphoglucose isomerase-like protein (cupin superfamily)
VESARIEIGPVSPDAFVDERGWIENIAFGEFRCVGLIFSKAGSVRSNHFHKTDSHVLYVLSGEMHYYERELDGEYGPEPVVLKAGDQYYTGPLLVHRTYFPVDTVLISASKNPRDHVSHESDVVRVDG